MRVSAGASKPWARNGTALALAVAVACLLGFYVLLMLWAPQFGPTDDEMLIWSVKAGKFLPLFVHGEIGRFVPLSGQAVNLVSLVSIAPLAFYAVNAVELMLLFLLFVALGREFAGPAPVLGAFLLLLLSPGMPTAWLRLFVDEREALFFFVAFLWFYFAFARRQGFMLALGALVCANLALYAKEPGFLMLGTFAGLRLLAARDREHDTRALDALLLASALVFILAYYVFAFRFRGPELYGASSLSPAARIAVGLGRYATTDPLLFFLVLPAALWRAWAAARSRRLDPVADPLLFAAAAYQLALLLLLLSSPYYWLPAYGFGLPGLLALWSRGLLPPHRSVVAAGAAALLVMVLSAVPQSLAIASFNKYVPRNFEQMIAVLHDRIAGEDAAAPVGIYLFAVMPGDDVEEFWGSLKLYLVASGLSPDRFVIHQSMEPAPRPGDYFILSPLAQRDPDAADAARLERDYRLVWRSVSRYAIPDLGLHALLKYVAVRYLHGASGGVNLVFGDPVDFAVYRRR